jgi:hypothetical protein
LSATTSRRVRAYPRVVLQARIRRAATPDQSVPDGARWTPMAAGQAGRATTAAASDVRSGPAAEAGLLPDLNAPRWNTGAAWLGKNKWTPPEVTGAASGPHKCSGYQACTMRRVARSRRQAHENRVLTQTRGAEPYRGMLRVGARCCSCREHRPGGRTFSADPALACRRSLPTGLLRISAHHKGTRAPARVPRRWVIHNSRRDRQDNIRRGATTRVW